jgi:hypothetical protein
MLLGPRSLKVDDTGGGGLFGNPDTIGWHVITPFQVENSDESIMVNRGWV